MTMKQLLLTIGVASTLWTSAGAQTLKSAIQLSENEEYQSASQAFDQLLAKEPTNGDYYYYAGENLFNDNMKEKATALYKKGVEVSPNNPLNYIGLGKIAYVAGNTEEANAQFFKAKTLAKGKNATVFSEIAKVYIESDIKDEKAATNLLNQAQALEPNNPKILLLLGDAALIDIDGASKAIKFYEHALDLERGKVV